jgi:hypothetical protein
MRRLDLDFAHDGPPVRPLGLALLAIGIAAVIAVLSHLTWLNRDLERVAAQLSDAMETERRTRRAAEPTAAEAASLARDIAEANQVAASLNVGWPGLFKRLESVRVPSVSLVAIQPETGGAGRRFRVTGEARALAAALSYVSLLAGTSGFANVHLASHEVLADKAGASVQFVVSLDWLPSP